MTGLGYNPHTFSIIHNQPKAPTEDEGQEEMFMKIIKSLSLILLVMAVGTTGVYAYDFEKDGIYYNILSEEDRTVEITNQSDWGGGYRGEIVIPQRVINDGKTYSVTTIDEKAFYYCTSLTSISMPAITTIGDSAFFYCNALSSVSMPAVMTIGDCAFSDCNALSSVSMPAVTTIGDCAFSSCNALSSVSMPAVTTIRQRAFSNCPVLASVFIPATCISIVANPFIQCTALKDIKVDKNNPNFSAADGALYDKDKTTLIGWPVAEGDIAILSSVRTIGDEAFGWCDALTSVSMPSVTTISDGAFCYCNALSSVSMPSVRTIEDYAFLDCYALTSIEMPEVTTIGESAFSYCDALTSVDILASITTIGDCAFDACYSLASVYCHWKEPLECNPRFGDDVLMNATLYIPKGTMGAYSKVDPWRNFWNIKEME